MPNGARSGPNGHRYRTARRAVLDHSTICHLCGHDGADQADHIGPRSLNPELDDADPTNLAPAHGVNGCPTCGEKCNQVKGNGTLTRPISSRSW
jgi:5-methylcytosine-specific restriction endonuclease McrA